MSKAPLVSVITPSYNQAAFLEQTLRSVLAQDYQPVEYLVVDGASNDNSVEIIERYSERLAWWVSEPDAGQAQAINKGLQRASGEIVAWLNSDDLYLPGAISQAVGILQANPELGMVFGDAITIDAQGRPLSKLAFDDWGLAELMRFRIICQPAVFMRRSVLENAGLLDPSYHMMLDHHLWIRMARLALIRHAPALWAADRHHPGAKNVAQAQKFSHEALRILEWMQTQPDLAPLIAGQRKRALGGAYRLSARYLLDGGKPWQALRHYGLALWAWPGFALKHWQRMAYAVLCLAGVHGLSDRLRANSLARRRKALLCELRQYPAFQNSFAAGAPHPGAEQQKTGTGIWPGLDLES
ncbi:MAG: glycosyltransferase [Anaerolineales bacterium]|nr:glycosyltransferase [Anaerolineales bacterium]